MDCMSVAPCYFILPSRPGLNRNFMQNFTVQGLGNINGHVHVCLINKRSLRRNFEIKPLKVIPFAVIKDGVAVWATATIINIIIITITITGNVIQPSFPKEEGYSAFKNVLCYTNDLVFSVGPVVSRELYVENEGAEKRLNTDTYIK